MKGMYMQYINVNKKLLKQVHELRKHMDLENTKCVIITNTEMIQKHEFCNIVADVC